MAAACCTLGVENERFTAGAVLVISVRERDLGGRALEKTKVAKTRELGS